MDRRALSKCVEWIESTLVLGEVHAFAQGSGASTDELQKQTQNPMANLISSEGGAKGLGDLNPTFFSPAKPQNSRRLARIAGITVPIRTLPRR